MWTRFTLGLFSPLLGWPLRIVFHYVSIVGFFYCEINVCLSLLPGFHSPAPQFKFKKEAPESFYYFLGRTLIGPAWGMYPPTLQSDWQSECLAKERGAGWKQSSLEGEFFLFVYNCIYLFIFGCAGSSLLCRLFFSCRDWGLLSSYRARVSHCSDFSCFQEPLCSTWDLPGPGIKPQFLIGRRILYHWATGKVRWKESVQTCRWFHAQGNQT